MSKETTDTVLAIWLPGKDSRWEGIAHAEPVQVPGTFAGSTSGPIMGHRGANPDLIQKVLEKICKDLGVPCDASVLVEHSSCEGAMCERIVWRLIPSS